MLLGLGQDYKNQSAQAMGTAAGLTQARRENNAAIKEAEKQGQIGLVTSGAGLGASIGMAGGPIGAGIGAGIGAAAGLLASFF